MAFFLGVLCLERAGRVEYFFGSASMSFVEVDGDEADADCVARDDEVK